MKHLNWVFYGDREAFTGYAYVARQYSAALEELGVRTDVEAETIIVHTIPIRDVFSWRATQKAGVYTMWEHGRLPPAIAAGIECFDFAVVPCQYSADLFSGLVDRVYVLPHGINPSEFWPKRHRPREEFVVLAPATNLRKGTPQVIEAFRKAGLPNARLVLKGADAHKHDPDGATVIDHALSPDELRSMYWNADVLISGARGEGWDLIAWEALACGTPVIVPNHTGYKQWNRFAQVRLEKWKPEPSPVNRYGPPGDWLVMDVGEMTDALVYAYENRQKMKAAAMRAAKQIAETHKWSDVMADFLDKLGDLPPVTDGPIRDKQVMSRAVGVKDLDSFRVGPHAGGPIRPGAHYKLPREVVRVLAEAGYLEASEDYEVKDA